MRTLFTCILVSGVAINFASAAVIPVSGSFDPSWGDRREFSGAVTVFDRTTGRIDLVIGSADGGLGLSQEFHLPLDIRSRDLTLDFAVMQQRVSLDGGHWAGALLDFDVIDLFEPDGTADDEFRVIDARIYIYDTGEDFSGYWQFDRDAEVETRGSSGRVVPEPSSWLLLVMGGAFLVRRKHR